MTRKFTIGIDEVGRGPLAGPVVAAAVALPERFGTVVLADSKQLTAAARARIAAELRVAAVPAALGWVTAQEIDALNIHNATLLAMTRAFEALLTDWPEPAGDPDAVLVDGKFCPPIPCPCRPIVAGDRTIPAIQAASVIAKVARDEWMCAYAVQDPRYRFEVHKGYPTALHRDLLRRHGPCAIHRRSFRGVEPG